MSFREYLAEQQQLIDRELDRLVPPESTPPETIHRAMRYSLFAGGKRVRPMLCMEAARAISDAPRGIETAACSLEFIHTYSLIHDDLPALDNDDYRRGKLTCHKVFGEAMAILAGDALLTLAFEMLSKMNAVGDDRKTRMIAELATAAGTVGGMIGGQVADLEGEGKPPDAQLLESYPPRQDRRAAARERAHGRDLRGRGRASSLTPCPVTASTSAWRFRSSTTCWMSSSRPKRSAKPRARMRSSRRSRFRQSTASRNRGAWPRANGVSAHQALDDVRRRARGRLRELADLIVQRKA